MCVVCVASASEDRPDMWSVYARCALKHSVCSNKQTKSKLTNALAHCSSAYSILISIIFFFLVFWIKYLNVSVDDILRTPTWTRRTAS